MWNVAHSKRFASIHSTVRLNTSGLIVVEAENETAVHLDAVAMQQGDPAGVVLGGGGAFARVAQVPAIE